ADARPSHCSPVPSTDTCTGQSGTMLDPPTLDLPIVGAEELDEPTRRLLRPGELMEDRNGIGRRLPTHYYRVPSWKAALGIQLTPNFGLWELIDVDVRE